MRKLFLLPVLFCFLAGFAQEDNAENFCETYKDFTLEYKKGKIKRVFGNEENAIARMILGDVVDVDFKLYDEFPMYQKMYSVMGQKREYYEEYLALLYAIPTAENPDEVKAAMDEVFMTISTLITTCDCKKSQENTTIDVSYEAGEIAYWDCGKKGKIELRSIENRTSEIHTMVLVFDKK